MAENDFQFLEKARRVFRQIKNILQQQELLSDSLWKDVEEKLVIACVGSPTSRRIIQQIQQQRQMMEMQELQMQQMREMQELQRQKRAMEIEIKARKQDKAQGDDTWAVVCALNPKLCEKGEEK